MLGLCRVSMGDIRQGVAAYERAIKLEPEMREAWLNLGQARWGLAGGPLKQELTALSQWVTLITPQYTKHTASAFVALLQPYPTHVPPPPRPGAQGGGPHARGGARALARPIHP